MIKETYLSVVHLACAEQSIERVVAWDNESGKVHKELSTNVEEDEEEVQACKTKYDVDFGNVGGLLKVVKDWVLRQLLIELRDLVLCLLLEVCHLYV